MKKLKKSSTDKIIFGICGGLGEYLGVDPTAVRVIWVIAGFLSAGFPLTVLYIVLAFIIPPDDGIIDI